MWRIKTSDAAHHGNMPRLQSRRPGIAETFARIFYRNAINIGLPIIECPEASKGIEPGDEVTVDFDSGIIRNLTKGTQFKGQAFPEFMQKIIDAEGLVNYINQAGNR